MSFARNIMFAITLVTTAFSSGQASALSMAEQLVRMVPVSVEGFAHQFIKQRQIHLYDCKIATCGPNARVSYLFLTDEGKLDFSGYISLRKQVAGLLKKQAPEGVKLRFEQPDDISDGAFTIYTQTRQLVQPDGAVIYIVSSHIYRKGGPVSLISSSTKRASAIANRDKFIIALRKATTTK